MDVKITLFPLHGHIIILDAPASEKDSKQCSFENKMFKNLLFNYSLDEITSLLDPL